MVLKKLVVEGHSHHQAAFGLGMIIVSLFASGEMVASFSTWESEQWELALNEAVNGSVKLKCPFSQKWLHLAKTESHS